MMCLICLLYTSISKKVADKLSGMCKTDKENYEKYWDDISPFIKFGCLKDEKFCEKMSDYVLFKNLDHKYMTLKECIEKNGGKAEPEEKTEGENAEQSAEKKETEKTTIYYVTCLLYTSKILLEMKQITKTFPGVKALDNVNLKVEEGAIHALVGENGAGKSKPVSYTHL